MDRETLGKKLNWSRCVECGECLLRCRYLSLERAQAVAEMGLINKGQADRSRVMADCVSCYACNAFCPRDAHPYERIRSLRDADYERDGLPLRTSYLMPTRRPNFRQDLRFDAAEKALLQRWASDEPPARVCLYPGCNLLSMPRLAEGRIFERLPVWGRWDLCCAEMYWRIGLREPVRAQAAKLKAFYEGKGIDELVFLCPAGYGMFSHVLPLQFGVNFDFKVTFFTDWLANEQRQGRLLFSKRLSGSVIVHDSCHGRVLGPDFLARQRTMLAAMGLVAFDAVDDLKDGLCCGIATGCRRYSVVDLVRQGLRELSALDRGDGDRIAVYCTGCLLTFNALNLARPGGKPVVHMLELIRQALGEKPRVNHTRRALQMVAGIARHALPHYFSRTRYYL